MHRVENYEERIQVIGGELFHIVTAQWKNISIDIIKENDSGKHFCRNLYTSCWGGYCVAFPGEYFSRYDTRKAEVEEWDESPHFSFYGSRKPEEWEKKLLADTFPGFNYVLAKWENATLWQIFAVLPFWKEHKEVEFLCAAGYAELATKKMFYKLSEKKRKEIIRFISKHLNQRWNLKEIQEVLKYKLTEAEWEKFSKFKRYASGTISYPLYKYLSKQCDKLDMDGYRAFKLYQDYKSLCKNCGHSFKEDYWRFPGNIREAHNKVLAEWDAICQFNRLKREAEEKRTEEEKMRKLVNLTNHISKFNAEIDGYRIYFSASLDEWEKQAKVLHQCIVHCNYMDKVTANQCRIAFIEKDGFPVATVQILPGNEIGQFYGDEIDRNNCKPNAEVTAAVHKWIKGLPVLIKQRKAA